MIAASSSQPRWGAAIISANNTAALQAVGSGLSWGEEAVW